MCVIFHKVVPNVFRHYQFILTYTLNIVQYSHTSSLINQTKKTKNMKKLIISFVLAIATTFAFAQNGPGQNVQVGPKNNGNPNAPMDVCYGTELFVWIAGGYSFSPVSYLWNTGETTPTIIVTTSGTYSFTVTGYLGQSNNLVTVVRSRYYTVGPNPVIVPLTALKVCKFETVELSTPFPICSGATIEWFTGQGGYSVGNNFQYTFNVVGGGNPHPDTLTVWYRVSVNGCTMNSNTVLIRSYRETPGLAEWLCNSPGRLKKNLTDSVPVGMVMNWVLSDELKYRVQFTEVTDSLNVIITETAVGSKYVHLNVLEVGKQYYVETWPVVNGVIYCSGDICTIGIKPASISKIGEINETELSSGPKNFKVYSLAGQLIWEKKDAEEFNQEWLQEINPQVIILQTIDLAGVTTSRKIAVAR